MDTYKSKSESYSQTRILNLRKSKTTRVKHTFSHSLSAAGNPDTQLFLPPYASLNYLPVVTWETLTWVISPRPEKQVKIMQVRPPYDLDVNVCRLPA